MMKRNWGDTVARLYEEVPEAKNVDWGGLFRSDPQILGSLINDVIKVDISEKGRPGKRSASNREDIAADLKKLTSEDYSSLKFRDALIAEMNGRSLRQIAALSGLDKMVVKRLVDGKGEPPTPAHMEALAKAFRKDPSYFIEYRVAYICSALYEMLIENSESATIFYSKLKSKQ